MAVHRFCSPSSSSVLLPLPTSCKPLRRRRPLLRCSAAAEMSSFSPSPMPPLLDKRVVLGCGSASVDYLATVAAFPNPDDKIRSLDLKIEGGGNAGNALTCAARLGLKPRIISKVSNDIQGKNILSELETDGVDTSFMVVAEEGNSPFTYIIVENQNKTRTCIHTPGYPPMVPNDLTQRDLFSALEKADIVYFDGRLHETALVIAEEATCRNIPILVDAERKREGLDELLSLCTYAVCSEKFPQAWTSSPSIAVALVSMLVRLPKLQFVIVTMGEKGCLMLERNIHDDSEVEDIDAESLLQFLQRRIDHSVSTPTCVSSKTNMRISAGVGSMRGRLLICTAEKIPPSELIDTTGAGDAFIGAVLYALCAGMPPEKMLPFASQVAAIGCRALGARSGLPWRSDTRLVPFWPQTCGTFK